VRSALTHELSAGIWKSWRSDLRLRGTCQNDRSDNRNCTDTKTTNAKKHGGVTGDFLGFDGPL
jgi:hypothetical protein